MALRSLLTWCTQNDVFIDPRICVCHDEAQGIHVLSGNESIPPNAACKLIELSSRSFEFHTEFNASFTVVRIPKTAVLSVKSCSVSEHIPFEIHGLGAQLGLSFALYSEK
jgi:stringent starvation protein B